MHLCAFLLTYVVIPWGNTAAGKDPMINTGMFEGDILGMRRPKDRNAVPFDSDRWSGGEIPYVIDKSLDEKMREALKTGMDHISDKTCIRFKERTSERDYIKVFKGKGCYSDWGRIGGQQVVSLGLGCFDLGTVVHELMHAVGFEHEHNRSDRDDYLTIHWNNIDVGFEDAFEPLMPHEERLLNDFDFDSIMLYGSEAFSRGPGLKTMEAQDGTPMPEVKQKKGLSDSDIKRIKMLYECEYIKG